MNLGNAFLKNIKFLTISRKKNSIPYSWNSRYMHKITFLMRIRRMRTRIYKKYPDLGNHRGGGLYGNVYKSHIRNPLL